ncbi:hypothetical protein PybrP1_012189 [[Pythium] brassicae (nom. inval.)]|nr:hypothetical protein PybrP1_012189 [[Pythium] brassicae (nom. inval.)]
MLPPAQLATASSARSAFALQALARFLLKSKSAQASRLRQLLLLGTASATGASALYAYIARCVCRTPLEAAHLAMHVSAAVTAAAAQFIARGFRPLYPNWTFSFEVLRAAMRSATELYGHRIADELHAKRIRRVSEVFGTSLGFVYTKLHGSRVEPVHVNGLEHLWIKASPAEANEAAGGADASSNRARFVVLYYHGGGYAVLSPRMYISFCNTFRTAICEELRQALPDAAPEPQVDFFLANYRKAPEHSFPVPAQDALAMYQYVVEHEGVDPSRVIVAGDSAGGGLVMSTLLRLRDGKTPELMPRAAILCCPSVDMSVTEDFEAPPHCVLSSSMVDVCRSAYHPTPHDASTWADASPVHCDLRGLVPVFLQTATLDYLHNHSQRLMAKAARDGVANWELDVQEGVPHVFTVFPTPVLPHAMVGVQNMARFAATHFCHAWRETSDADAQAA